MDPAIAERLAMLRKAGEQMVAAAPHSGALGLEVVSVENAAATLRAPWREELTDGEGRLANGVITALIDHCCGLAIVASGAARPRATLDLRIDHTRPPAWGAAVTARAHCYHAQADIGFVRAEAFDAEGGEPIAAAQATFMLSRDFTAPWKPA